MKPKPVELRFTPVDNQRLANLCGALDENLRQIETALDVSIARRAERFAVRGEPDKTARAAQALERFYQSATRALTLDDIQLELVGLREPETTADAAELPDPVLATRKTDLRDRKSTRLNSSH